MESNLDYKIVKSKRKTCAIQIHPNSKIIVRTPLSMTNKEIESFVNSKRDWIEKSLKKYETSNTEFSNLKALSKEDIYNLKQKAEQIIPSKVDFYASKMGVSYNKITIKCQKSRWGSCSSKNNLNFNCLLMLTPNDVIDYIIVHELCHLKEMNHSKQFWNEVKTVLPEYEKSHKWLKENGNTIIQNALGNI